MAELTHKRCWNHPEREAAARCPQCGQYFCRECVTEHDERVVCAVCLRQLNGPAEPRRSGLTALRGAGLCLGGFFIAWIFFHGLGQALLLIPTSFHEGTLWSEIWPEE